MIPTRLLDLPFNTPYLVAMLAHGYRPGPEWYDPAKIADPAVRDFMPRVKLEIDRAGRRGAAREGDGG